MCKNIASLLDLPYGSINNHIFNISLIVGICLIKYRLRYYKNQSNPTHKSL